jgi:hypothetical protein
MGDLGENLSVTLVLDTPDDEKFRHLPKEEVIEALTSKYTELLQRLVHKSWYVTWFTDRPYGYQKGWWYHKGSGGSHYMTDSRTVYIPINLDYFMKRLKK